MDIKELQQFYAFKELGAYVSRVQSDPTFIAMTV